jgi:hypothetical protein
VNIGVGGVNPVRGGGMLTCCGAAMNRDANLLPASEAMLLPADTTSLDARSPIVFPVIRLTILAIVSNIPPPPTT